MGSQPPLFSLPFIGERQKRAGPDEGNGPIAKRDCCIDGLAKMGLSRLVITASFIMAARLVRLQPGAHRSVLRAESTSPYSSTSTQIPSFAEAKIWCGLLSLSPSPRSNHRLNMPMRSSFIHSSTLVPNAFVTPAISGLALSAGSVIRSIWSSRNSLSGAHPCIQLFSGPVTSFPTSFDQISEVTYLVKLRFTVSKCNRRPPHGNIRQRRNVVRDGAFSCPDKAD